MASSSDAAGNTRIWKFERIDGSTVIAIGSEVEIDEAGYIVRGERLGFAPYQCWAEEVEERVG